MSHLHYFTAISLTAILITIPAIAFSAYAQGYGIPEIPNLEDFDIPDIPSQEEIEKMMEQNEVSGTYINNEYGIEVKLPDGWSGMESNFKDPSTGEWITGFQAMEGGLNANMDSMQKGEFVVIMLSIIDKSQDKSPPDVNPPSDDFDVDCDIQTAEEIKVNNKDAMKLQVECTGTDASMKARTYHYGTLAKTIMLGYMASPSSDFEKDIDKFENSVKTLKIQNQVDLTYEIPDSMVASQSATSEVTSVTKVPGWIKTNAEWWAAGAIGDSEFVQGIQFLIKEGIMAIPETAQVSSGDDSQTIPSWIKNNAEWWSQGLISDDDFVKGIQYLVEQGIMQV